MYVFPIKFVVAVDGVQMHGWMLWNNQFFCNFDNFALVNCVQREHNTYM